MTNDERRDAGDAAAFRELERVIGPNQTTRLTPGLRDAVERRGESIAQDVGSADDRAFFQANPDRTHRIRQCALGELETHRLLDASTGSLGELAPNEMLLVITKKLSPANRMRRFFYVPLGDVDAYLALDEDQCREIFEEMAFYPPLR